MHPQFTPISSLCGGVLIGISASLLMLGLGRIAGITGIVGGVLRWRAADLAWRLWFLAGLVGSGIVLGRLRPDVFAGQITGQVGGHIGRSSLWLVMAGLLVGFGTRMGNGCTSGHGVCGVGRLSRRSIVATAVFITTGALTVLAIRHFPGGGG
jgi:uncharacterized membrane protein YedE/YeeE